MMWKTQTSSYVEGKGAGGPVSTASAFSPSVVGGSAVSVASSRVAGLSIRSLMATLGGGATDWASNATCWQKGQSGICGVQGSFVGTAAARPFSGTSQQCLHAF